MSNYRKKKGNRVEAAVAAALTADGFIVRDGPHTLSGCDLYVFVRSNSGAYILHHEAEVKGRKDRTINGLLPKEKRAIWNRAKDAKALGIDYRLYFARFDGAKLPETAEVSQVLGLDKSLQRNGLHLALNKVGLVNLGALRDPPPNGSAPLVNTPEREG